MLEQDSLKQLAARCLNANKRHLAGCVRCPVAPAEC